MTHQHPPRAILDADILYSRVLYELMGRIAAGMDPDLLARMDRCRLPLIARVNGLINEALRDPAFVAQMRAQGGDPAGGGSAEFRSFLTQEISRWSKAVADSGATID